MVAAAVPLAGTGAKRIRVKNWQETGAVSLDNNEVLMRVWLFMQARMPGAFRTVWQANSSGKHVLQPQKGPTGLYWVEY
jgi:hypothetical protein